MFFSTCAIYDDSVYAFSRDNNFLIEHNIKKGITSLLGSIPNQTYSQGLVSKIFKYDEKILLVPNSASDIYVFNLLDSTWSKISFIEPKIKYKFATAFEYDNKVYMIGSGYKGIAIYDFAEEKLDYYSEIHDYLYKKGVNDVFFRDYAMIDANSVVMPSCVTNEVIRLNLSNMQFEVFTVGNVGKTYESIVYDNGKCFITPRNGMNLIIWDIISNNYEEIPLSIGKSKYGHYCGGAKQGNNIVFYAYNADKTCSYNPDSKEIKYDEKRYSLCSKTDKLLVLEDMCQRIIIYSDDKQVVIDILKDELDMIKFDICRFYHEGDIFKLANFLDAVKM